MSFPREKKKKKERRERKKKKEEGKERDACRADFLDQ